MRIRIEVSTDVAALGIWDRGQPARSTDESAVTLEQLAQRGEACIVRLGGDASGAVDLFVDEELPAEVLAEGVSVAEERTIVVRSGAIVVDGVERFGANSGDASSVVSLQNGTYQTRILVTRSDDELPEPRSEKEMRRLIGAAEVEYYDRTNRNGLLVGLSTLLVLPVLLAVVRWYVAVPVALIVFLAYFHVRQWFLKRNPRYQKIAERVVAWRLGGARPIVSIQLSRLA